MTEVQPVEATENSCQNDNVVGYNTKDPSEATLNDIAHNSNSTFIEQNLSKLTGVLSSWYESKIGYWQSSIQW